MLTVPPAPGIKPRASSGSAISDSGSGIPEAHRDKIFEPFFTTRDEGQGTGLGLAVSHGIVKDHDGWIEVENPAGGGSVFRVFLPCAVAAGRDSWEDAAPALAVADPIGKD